MLGLARYALPGIIVLTSVGAFLMCMLVIRYGFGSREIDLDTDEARRLAMTRVGHAVAAVCFAGAALLAVRAKVKGVNVDVQTRPLRDNETAYVVSLMDETNRPVTGADVMLVGKRRDGTQVQVTLAPTNEPGVHRGRLPTPDDGSDLRLRVVGTTTRFEVSLAREVSW